MRATITLTDEADGAFRLETVHHGGYSPSSPAHVASYKVMELMESLAQKRGERVQNITHDITAAPLADRTARQRQQLQVYEWLGQYRDEMPIAAVAALQEILGPLPSNAVPLDGLVRPTPEDVASN